MWIPIMKLMWVIYYRNYGEEKVLNFERKEFYLKLFLPQVLTTSCHSVIKEMLKVDLCKWLLQILRSSVKDYFSNQPNHTTKTTTGDYYSDYHLYFVLCYIIELATKKKGRDQKTDVRWIYGFSAFLRPSKSETQWNGWKTAGKGLK